MIYVPICVQVGCKAVASKRVETNYGYLGDVCEEHYAILLETYGTHPGTSVPADSADQQNVGS